VDSPPAHTEPLDLGVSIADAEAITLNYDGNDLLVHFIDWRDMPRTVIFRDAVAFKWQRVEDVGPGERWDGANVITGAHWLAELRRQDEALREHRHLKLNFNAAGTLEVICLAATAAE
jgi:hypothetical protein